MSLVFLFFIIILLMLSFGSFSNKFFGARFMSGSGITKVFAGYLIVLLATGILSFMVPKGESFSGEYLNDKEIQANETLNSDVYHVIESGKINEAEGLTEKEAWEFSLKGQLLNIKTMAQNATIFIEKVESLEGTVQVTHYTTFSYVDNVDITDRFTSPEVQFTDTTIKIFPADPVNIKLVRFTNAFPFTQFTEDGEQFSGNYGMMQGLDFIYIRVPADTEVSGDGYVIN
jgi:hypothetical protein